MCTVITLLWCLLFVSFLRQWHIAIMLFVLCSEAMAHCHDVSFLLVLRQWHTAMMFLFYLF
jgi:hypothetical protein